MPLGVTKLSGFGVIIVPEIVLEITSNQTDVDLWVEFNMPPQVATFRVRVSNGIVLSSSAVGVFAMDTTNNFASGSIFIFEMIGTAKCGGMGGAGGRSNRQNVVKDIFIDGGGGGGGYGGGIGFEQDSGSGKQVVDGRDGTSSALGAAGTSTVDHVFVGSDQSGTAQVGAIGGHALRTYFASTLDGGNWHGGGGGGGGTNTPLTVAPGAGGGAGSAGAAGTASGGGAGDAVHYLTAVGAPTQINSPDIQGSIVAF